MTTYDTILPIWKEYIGYLEQSFCISSLFSWHHFLSLTSEAYFITITIFLVAISDLIWLIYIISIKSQPTLFKMRAQRSKQPLPIFHI